MNISIFAIICHNAAVPLDTDNFKEVFHYNIYLKCYNSLKDLWFHGSCTVNKNFMSNENFNAYFNLILTKFADLKDFATYVYKTWIHLADQNCRNSPISKLRAFATNCQLFSDKPLYYNKSTIGIITNHFSTSWNIYMYVGTSVLIVIMGLLTYLGCTGRLKCFNPPK